MALDLHRYGACPRALADLLLHGVEQVVNGLLIEVELAVADNAEHGAVHNLVPAEERLKTRADDLINQDERRAGTGQAKEARDDRGNRQDCQLVLLLPLGHDGKRERLGRQNRKRPALVDRHRRHDRIERGFEVVVRPRPLVRVQLHVGLKADSLPGQLMADHAVVSPVQARPQLGRIPLDRVADLDRVEAKCVNVTRALLHQPAQRRHALHIELIEVAGKYGDELRPFERGVRRIFGLLYHPLVELQPVQIPVEVLLAVLAILDQHSSFRPARRAVQGCSR